jgi:glutamine synthetase
MAIAPEDTGTRAADVLARVEEENVEFIRFWFTDIFGQLKSFAVGREELAGALEDGMGFDGSSITGFNRIEESDMIAMADRRDPQGRPAVLRRAEARRRALRGRPALRHAQGARPR